MSTPIPFEAVQSIVDHESFIAFLKEWLEWPIPEGVDNLGAVSVPYDMFDDLGYKPGQEVRLEVSRLLAMKPGQPWGVFLFKLNVPRIYITDLRKIVRKLSSRRELMRNMPVWKPEHILIIATADWQGFQFLHLRGESVQKSEVYSFGWQGPQDGFLRTLCEFNLPNLRFPEKDLLGDAEAKPWIEKWQSAFDIKPVTEKFYQTLKEVYHAVTDEVGGVEDAYKAHVAELLINRLLFLRFVERKGWLDNDKRYLATHYARFNKAARLDKFYDEFLRPLFFDALNNPDATSRKQRIGNTHGAIPFLNGGLFSRSNEWDDDEVEVTGDALELLFEKLLLPYNFTIRETDPLDIEVAFDQDLLGYAYEDLIADRHGQGAYYTAPTEVNLMCRESLRAYLEERTEVPKEKIGPLVYGEEQRVKLSDGQAFDLYKALVSVKICDPAIGSGSYPVAMLKHLLKCFQIIARNISDEKLRQLCDADEYVDISDNYAIKLHIIERSIYGCDIDESAVEIARLRFWIELMVEMDKPHPLPNFDFKFLVGDSLVSFWQRHSETQFSDLDIATGDAIQFGKESLQALAIAKRSYFTAETEKQKRDACKTIADMRLLALRNIGLKHTPQGDSPDAAAKKHVHWKLDFAEVFAAETAKPHSSKPETPASPAGAGFDIVIANPPYLRQELIDTAFSQFGLGVDKADLIATYQKLTGFTKIDAKSDLYVFFFYRALMLLKHDGGVFCFICSNSWLDVGYGAQLQDYILKHCEIRAIIDNSAKRSFATADVNTTINLFVTRDPHNAVSERGLPIARFIAFRKPFEECVTEQTMRKAYGLSAVTSGSDYRIYPLAQDKLLAAGLDRADATDRAEEQPRRPSVTSAAIKTSKTIAKYGGDKWGGKYLRAPDIFFTILEKGKHNIVRLGDVAAVRFGLKTGCNDFFYLDQNTMKNWAIEAEFLKPVVISPRECQAIEIDPCSLKRMVFVCQCERQRLKNTNALRYIQWGENQLFNERPSCAGRRQWWSLEDTHTATLAWAMMHAARHSVHINTNGVVLDHNFFEILSESNQDQIPLSVCAISTFGLLMKELFGRQYGGGSGPIKNEGIDISKLLFVRPSLVKMSKEGLIAYHEVLKRAPTAYTADRMQVNTLELDEIIFDALSLNGMEREEMYKAVTQLVSNRLKKAQSL